jgi:hypothetical protein
MAGLLRGERIGARGGKRCAHRAGAAIGKRCGNPRAHGLLSGVHRIRTKESTMARSSILGTDRAAAQPKGRDLESLGPSDRSDSGSDMVGIDEGGSADPAMPVDKALSRDDIARPLTPEDALDGGASDSTGTGERRSAAGDAGAHDGADIMPDRVFDPEAEGADELDENEDPDLAFVDEAAPDEDAGEDGEETPPSER